MIIKVGSAFETQMVNKAKQFISEGGVQMLAHVIFQACQTNYDTPFNDRLKSDSWLCGLVYSEFYAEGNDNEELLRCEDLRHIYCTRLAIDSYDLFKRVENLHQAGRYA